MNFLKKFHLQQALKEEARGNFAQAAAAYAKAEEFEKVGEMYEAIGEMSRELSAKIQAYQQALRWLKAPERLETLAGKLAALMEDDVRQDGQVSRIERHVLQQIAEYYATAKRWKDAGRIYEELHLPEQATEMYVRGGEIELVERVSAKQEQHDHRAHTAEQAYQEAEEAYRTGKRDKAHQALKQCLALDASHQQAATLFRQLSGLLERSAALHVLLPAQEQEYVLFSSASIIIGRSEENDLVLPQTDVSRRHAKIGFDGLRLMVEDMGSSNGTRINGLRIQQAAELRHQDVLGIGRQASFNVKIRLTASNAAATLHLQEHQGVDMRYVLCSKEILIGQDASCDVVLQQRFPSVPACFFKMRHHAPFWVMQIHPQVRALELNGLRVERYVAVLPGDTLYFDGMTMVIE